MRLFATLVLATFVTHCSSANFQGGPRKAGAADDDGEPSRPAPGEARESFELSARSGKLDVVWLIDNSGSMSEEAEQVRKNFNAFLDYPSKVDLRLALISAEERAGGGSGGIGGVGGIPGIKDTGVTLPAAQKKKGHVQVTTAVGSTNALAIAASASCEASATASAGGAGGFPPGGGFEFSMTICGERLNESTAARGAGDDFGFLENPAAVDAVKGSLRGFFRKDANRVYVVVTDDNASFVTDANFMNLLKKADPDVDPTLYAFRGATSQAGCSVAKRGAAYESLASSTGGAVFDICDADWSANFGSLAKSVRQLAESSFTLKSPVKQVLAVTLDGQELAAGDYEVNGRVLSVRKDVLTKSSGKLEVRYKPKA